MGIDPRRLLLDLEKIEAGEIELNPQPTLCQGLLEAAAMSLRPLAERKGLQLVISPEESELSLRIDRRALSQILLNLISNSIKFTERGSVRVAVSRGARNGRRTVEFNISDTGIGIRREDQSRLLSAISPGIASRRRLEEAGGLGLHVSQRLAEALGGTIAIRSEYGAGSTFILELPER